MALRLREGLLAEAFSVLRKHGDGREECVLYLTGPRSQPMVVDELLHPIHIARPGYYEIDAGWLTTTWIQLARRDREIRVQVHTHGQTAFHSRIDDEFPIVQTEGFLSLVIPNFAMGGIGLRGAFLAELQYGGRWIQRDPERELVVG